MDFSRLCWTPWENQKQGVVKWKIKTKREREKERKNRKIDGGGKTGRLKVVVKPGGGNVRR